VNQFQYSIQYSTVTANLEGLMKLMLVENKLHLLPEIPKHLIEYQPDEQDRVPLEHVTQNIHTIDRFLNDPHFGVKVLNYTKLENIPLYSTLKQCKTILDQRGESIPFPLLTTLIGRYFSIITEVVSLDIHYLNNSVELVFTPNRPDIVSHHQIEGVAVGIYRIIQSLSHAKLVSVDFSHGGVDTFNYKDIFGLRPEFSKDEHRMIYATSENLDGLDTHSLYTVNTMQRLLDTQFPNLDDVDRCKHIIKSILSFGEPTREHVSEILNISVSTLQRRLRAHQTNFKDILLETRKDTAHDLLLNQNRNPSELAFLLGYKSSSQFFKAFKTWFSCTPLEYKKNNTRKKSEHKAR